MSSDLSKEQILIIEKLMESAYAVDRSLSERENTRQLIIRAFKAGLKNGKQGVKK